MPVEWTGDGTPADGLRIEHNLAGLLRSLVADAPQRRIPTIGMARDWHRRIFDGIAPPIPYFAGGVRDSDPNEPELVNYEVGVRGPVGVALGVPAAQVWQQLITFRTTLRAELAQIDQLHPVAAPAVITGPADQVIKLCAWTHGEWVRIHPFVNGNGRTARVWANWVALRYSLPAFVRLRPRPAGNTYATAAERSMMGDHRYMEVEVTRLLTTYLASGGTA